MHALRTLLSRAVREQSGFSLVECLVASLALVVLLIAIANVADAGRVVATRDGEYAVAVSESQPGLDRMVRELRQAIALNAAGATPGECSTSANCVDFNIVGRRPTDATGNPIAGAPRPLNRVRYACVPAAGSAIATCRRYQSANVAVPATSPGSAVIDRVLNGAAASATPIFRYRTKTGAELAAADSRSLARTIDVSIQVPAKGQRKAGLAHNVVLQDGVQLKNIDFEATP